MDHVHRLYQVMHVVWQQKPFMAAMKKEDEPSRTYDEMVAEVLQQNMKVTGVTTFCADHPIDQDTAQE